MNIKSKHFNIGTIVFTHAVNDAVVENEQFAKDIVSAMKRFCDMDWGEMCKSDKQINDNALNYTDDLYIFAAYKTCKGKIYIITDKATDNTGNNVTTILWAEEH